MILLPAVARGTQTANRYLHKREARNYCKEFDPYPAWGFTDHSMKGTTDTCIRLSKSIILVKVRALQTFALSDCPRGKVALGCNDLAAKASGISSGSLL